MKRSAKAQFIRAAVLAKALKCDKKTVHNRARAQGWKSRKALNHLEYIPPAHVVAAVQSAPTKRTKRPAGTRNTDPVRVLLQAALAILDERGSHAP